MFRTNHNYTQFAGKPYRLEQIIPILSAHHLLSSPAHQAYIEEVSTLVGIGDQHFNLLYLDLMNCFSEFVQLIPKKPTDVLGSFLNMGLRRAWRGLMLLKDKQPLNQDPALTYLLYSALLLRDLSDISINQKITVCDEEGIFIADWIPASGNLLNRGPYYRLFFRQSIQARMAKELTVLLAKQIMPHEGLVWLSSDAQQIVDWLVILLDESLIGGVLADILTIIKLDEDRLNKLDQRSLLEHEYWLDPVDPKLKSLPAISVVLKTATGTAVGEAFLNWLQDGVAQGQFAINSADAGLHAVEGGLFIEYPEIFRKFSEQFDKPLHIVFTQFAYLLGFLKQGGDVRFDQFFSSYPISALRRAGTGFDFATLSSKEGSLRKGIVLQDASLVFAKSMPEISQYLKMDQSNTQAANALPVIVDSTKRGPAPAV
ncbi:MAG: hypothetical protein A3F41_05410 [Coxiella sp. RIFCSPHIGHO2_12_FULL_44_14]|nr:MAG: hypothetical protein A3F41_05410 [Coxiella sp. RIFCSPHIGHO2_12_FULL_44_14]